MTTYRFTGRNVEADSPKEAAEVFAGRIARREYGRRGYCRNIRLDCWTEDGRDHTFEAFIGHNVGNGTCSGHNVWIFVHRVGDVTPISPAHRAAIDA